MKTIRKNLLLLAFAAGALFVIGNNVLAVPDIIIVEPPGEVGKGILLGNLAGTSFCCCPGYRDCGAAPCPPELCKNIN